MTRNPAGAIRSAILATALVTNAVAEGKQKRGQNAVSS
jgi:hypothetical protein